MRTPAHDLRNSGRSTHARKLIIGLAALFGILLMAAPSAMATPLPKNSNVKKFTLVETDYHFSPDHMTWTVGETVRITLKNESKNPATEHEFMMGKNLETCKSKFGNSHPCGWKQNLITKDTMVAWGQGDKIAELQHDEPAHAALKSGGQVTMQFKVRDKPGTWHFACFEQKGEHYQKGMHGTITIKPASGSSG